MSPRTLPEMLLDVAARHGALEALVDGATRISHADLLRRSAVVATRLRELGVVPGDRVAILLPNGWQYAVSYFGVQLAGAIGVLVNTRFARAAERHGFDNARPARPTSSTTVM